MPPKAKARKGKKQPKKPRPQRGANRQPRAVGGLDAGALAYRQLLLDPCNARFTSPAYTGLGSGNFVRKRFLVAAEGSSVEGTYVFQLGSGTYLKGSHVAGTAGTPYTFSAHQMWASGMNNQRCIAGCVKVRYIGAESARSGLISTLAAPTLLFAAGAQTTATGAAGLCPFTHRTGEVAHEVKFVPNEGDEEFGLPGTIVPDKSSIAITYRSCPAQTIMFEVTAVLEIEQVETFGEGGTTVINSILPATANTLNQVLRSLGPVTSWAYTNVVVPTIRAAANKLVASGITTSSMASIGMAALTI